jgi:hypothetical protein
MIGLGMEKDWRWKDMNNWGMGNFREVDKFPGD